MYLKLRTGDAGGAGRDSQGLDDRRHERTTTGGGEQSRSGGGANAIANSNSFADKYIWS